MVKNFNSNEKRSRMDIQETPLKFNSLSLKIGNPQRKLIFQPSFFRGKLLNLRGLMDFVGDLSVKPTPRFGPTAQVQLYAKSGGDLMRMHPAPSPKSFTKGGDQDHLSNGEKKLVPWLFRFFQEITLPIICGRL